MIKWMILTNKLLSIVEDKLSREMIHTCSPNVDTIGRTVKHA